MKLGEIQADTMKLIESYDKTVIESTTDTDEVNKFFVGINACMQEVSRLIAIKKVFHVDIVSLYIELPKDLRTVTAVRVDGKETADYSRYSNILNLFKEGKEIDILYDAIAPRYTQSTDKETVLPFDDDVCSVLPFGIAKIILCMTGYDNEAQIYDQKYYGLLQQFQTNIQCITGVVPLKFIGGI